MSSWPGQHAAGGRANQAHPGQGYGSSSGAPPGRYHGGSSGGADAGSGAYHARAPHHQRPAVAPAVAHPWGSRTVDVFTGLRQVGEGTYGQVYEARNKETHEHVALKKVRMDNEKEGFPITAIREIKILKELRHANVIGLKEIVTSGRHRDAGEKGKSIYMVFEYMDHDLTGLMEQPGLARFSMAQIKCLVKQLLTAVHYCHKNQILHRDIKSSNLLINNQGELKLADFGLARPASESKYTNRVITLWYRPPELLLGADRYTTAVDMWSVGCIIAELLARRPVFPGRDEVDQMDQIWKLCGAPTPETWPRAQELKWYNMCKPKTPFRRRLREQFRHFPKDALDLVDGLLQIDPERRLTAANALDHAWLWSDPLPAQPHQMPKFPSIHEFEAKRKRQEQRSGSVAAPPAVSGSSSTASRHHHHQQHQHQQHRHHQHQHQHPHQHGRGAGAGGYRGSQAPTSTSSSHQPSLQPLHPPASSSAEPAAKRPRVEPVRRSAPAPATWGSTSFSAVTSRVSATGGRATTAPGSGTGGVAAAPSAAASSHARSAPAAPASGAGAAAAPSSSGTGSAAAAGAEHSGNAFLTVVRRKSEA